MSVQAMTWVLDHSRTEHDARLVLLAIANDCDKFGRHAWPGDERIGEAARVSERTVRRCKKIAAALGELAWAEITGRAKQGRPRFLYWFPPMVAGAGVAPVDEEVAERFGLTPDNLSGVSRAPHRTNVSPTPDNLTGDTGQSGRHYKDDPSFTRPDPPQQRGGGDRSRKPLHGLLAIGFKRERAEELIKTYGEIAVARQLLNLERHPDVVRKSGWIVAALRDDYELADEQSSERIPQPLSSEEAEAIARRMWPEKFATDDEGFDGLPWTTSSR